MYYAEFVKRVGWRIRFQIPGALMVDICGAINEQVARETCAALAAYRSVYP